MSRMSPVPAAELATKDDVRAVNEDWRVVKADLGRVEGEVDAFAVRVDEKFDRLVESREADRQDAGRRAWRIALALPVEVVVLFAVAAAILEWLRG